MRKLNKIITTAAMVAAILAGTAPKAAGGTVSRFFRAALCAAPEGSDSPLYRVVL